MNIKERLNLKAYQNQQVHQSQSISMRNPMYSDFDYNKYSAQQKAPHNPNIKIEDSLDALQYEYNARNGGPYNQYPQHQQQQPEAVLNYYVNVLMVNSKNLRRIG